MSTPNRPEGDAGKATIFISHASEDDAFVDWLGYAIEDLGYRAIIDHWDFAAHRSFITQMDRALDGGARLMAIISPAFVASPHCRTEWEIAYQADPDGEKGLLVCGRIADCDPGAILKRYPWQDFFGTQDETELKRRLCLLIERKRDKPSRRPALPFLPGGKAASGASPQAGAAAAPPPSLIENYLHQVLHETQFLRLEVIDRRTATESASERLRLAGVYTRLEVLGGRDGDQLEKMSREDREPQRRSALAEADRHPRLALLGPPGSGKSTFTDMLALCLAGERLGRKDANLATLGDDWKQPALVPVRIALRDFAAQPGVVPLWDFCAARWRETLPGLADALRRHLLDEGGIFLLDGLDEVPEAAGIRQRVKDAVLTLGATFPKARLLLTSRTYAYQKQEWRLPDFAETVLAPFSEEQWDAFITRWYAHLAEIRPGLARATAEGQARLLRESIAARPHLQELAERPLLLTLMASLHALRGGTLPDRRHQLYEQSVDLLIDAWEKPKVVWRDGAPALQAEGAADFFNTDREQFRRALERLAFAAHRDQQDLRGCADVTEGALAAELLRLAGEHVQPQKLLDYIRDRAGILTHVAEGVYRFPHRSFQEYLAARHLCREGFPHEPARLVRADPERWREVFLLAGASVAATSPFAGWALLDALLPRSAAETPRPTASDWLSALVAGQLLVESHLADGETADADTVKRDRVRAWLDRLIGEADLPVVDRAAAGDTLAQLGDLRPGVGVNIGSGKSVPDFAWCDVPAGPFPMGNDPVHDAAAYEYEQPRWTCDLIREPYRIARYPVTVAQFAAFVDAGGYAERRWWSEAGWAWREKDGITAPDDSGGKFELSNHPRTGVSWFEAEAFCRWASDALRCTVFLPSEVQWERAARGTDARKFPWDDEAISAKFANFSDTGLGSTSAVGIFASDVSPAGLHDVSGNVWEWCATPWVENYENYASALAKLSGSEATALPRVFRGGSWGYVVLYCRAAFRFRCQPVDRNNSLGFRPAAVALK